MLGDGIIDAQYRRKVTEVCTPERFELAFDEVLNDAALEGNPLADMVVPWLRDNEHHFADLAARTAVKFLLGDPKKMMGGFASEVEDAPRPASRRMVRTRLIRHVMQERGLSRRKAREAVDQLTDAQIDAAVGALPVQGVGDWFKTIFDYIKEHWFDILKMLLPLLLILI